jgi:uncharacterized OsmC-like protein
MKTKQLTNGVPVDELVETMRAIRKEPKIASFVFRVRNAWKDGALNQAVADGFYGACEERTHDRHVFDMDEAPLLLGQDRGGNPVEVLLAALSGCITTTLVYHAAAQGIRLTEVESTYEGDLDLRGFLAMDDSVRPGYERIRVTFRVKGDAPPEKLDELVRFAEAHSPVCDMVTKGVPVKVERAR